MIIWSKVNQFLTGNNDSWSLNVKTLLNGMFKKGFSDTTNEAKIQPSPKSWIKILLGLVALSTILYSSVEWLGPIPFPWLTLIVATIVPLMIIIFLYEFNVIERMKISDLVLAFFVGSAISFYAVGYLSTSPIGIGLIDLIIAACIEEIAKIIPIFLAIRFFKIKRVGSAFFVGYVIGSGFQIAETMGYSTAFGLSQSWIVGRDRRGRNHVCQEKRRSENCEYETGCLVRSSDGFAHFMEFCRNLFRFHDCFIDYSALVYSPVLVHA